MVARRQGRAYILRKLNIQWVTLEQPGDENGQRSLGLVRNCCQTLMFECVTAGYGELKLSEQDSEVLRFVFQKNNYGSNLQIGGSEIKGRDDKLRDSSNSPQERIVPEMGTWKYKWNGNKEGGREHRIILMLALFQSWCFD